MSFEHRIWKLIVALALTFLVGIIGYELIEGWNLLDATYMTVITLATIGYGETHPLSDNGRVFTMFLILGGMTTVSYGALTITAMVADGELARVHKRRRMDKAISHLQGHHIVCGFGTTGAHIARELLATGREVVIVERASETLESLQSRQSLAERLGSDQANARVHYVAGDAASDHTLIQAGIHRAAGLFCTLGSDKDNLFVVLTARGLNEHIRIVSQCEDDETESKLRRAGADGIVSAKRIGGLRMASEMLRPAVVSFLDQMLRDPQGYRFEEVELKAGASVLGRPFQDSPAGRDTVVRLVAVAEASGGFTYNQPADLRLAAGQRLVFLGPSERLNRLRAEMNETD